MNNGATSIQKSYTFSTAEYENILELFSALQKEISIARHLPQTTRSKLFEKLEEMIISSGISVNNMDVFWSFIARTEIAFKVFEANRVPEQLIELAGIIWKVQCRAEGRPDDSALPIVF